ncbi:TolC family protein [Methylobacter sp. S3L5C]|uniref:TolC family protein n=1 Tax=Methylobacter sp. S3L5C TaxID=2839024 RepID=UPI001FACBEC3|nr:TolC family protein [Methylobacter sp. S3L5C]UOA07274.1 TolC family protein [Methylobacter sp. S3L5C]
MQKLFRLFFIFSFLSLLLISCAQFQDRPLKPDETALRIESRTLTGAGLQVFIESVVGRKTIWPFKLWDIDQLTLAAIYYHPDLALARAQADTAEAANITAAQRPNPSITVTPTWVRNLATAAVPWIAASAISIPIETAGKRDFRIKKADHLADAARLRIRDAAWLARGRLRLAMLEVFAAQEAERLLQQQVSIQKAMSERLEQQLSAGEISRLEVMRAHITLNQLQLNVSTARKRVAESRVMLAASIGVGVDALSDIKLDFTTLSKPSVLDSIPTQNLKEVALRERSDLLAALADYDAAQSALQLEIANQYPNIQANPGYAWEMGEHRWALGATMPLPVLHQNQGPIAEADAKRRELMIRFEALQLRILGDVDRARAGLEAVLTKWSDAEQQKQLQQDNLNSAQALFNVGETDHLALLGTELENAVAERARLDVLIEIQQALNALEDTLRYPISSKLTTTMIADSANKKIPQ